MKRSRKRGFTLIEVIVVIAILAILAAIAIPSITGYIEETKQSADMQQASSVMRTAIYAINTSEVRIPYGKVIEIAWSTNGKHSKDGSILVRAPVISSPLWKHGDNTGVSNVTDKEALYWIDKFISDSLYAVEGTQYPGYNDHYQYFIDDAQSKLANSSTDFGFHINTGTGEIAITYECQNIWVDQLGLPLMTD